MADEIAPARKLGKVRFLFFVAGLYDLALGALLLYMAPAVFAFAKTPMPVLPYVHFPAALLIVFGLLFWHVMFRPDLGRVLIPYGILLKLAVCATAGWYWFKGPLTWVWLVPAVVALVFLVLFLWAFCKCPGEDDL